MTLLAEIKSRSLAQTLRVAREMKRLSQLLKEWITQQPKSVRVAFGILFLTGFATHWLLGQIGKSANDIPAFALNTKPVPVAALSVGTQTIVNQFTTHASLQPRKEVTVRPNSNVTVRDVRVEIGQLVKRGDILASTSSEAQKLRAELDNLDLKMKNLDYQVSIELAKKSFLSNKEYQQKELEHRASRIRKRLAEIETAGAILSPIEGIVSEIALKSGDYIDNPSAYYIKIADTSSLRLQTFLPQTVAAKLVKGASANLARSRTDEFGVEHAESAVGMISGVAPVVDPKTGSVLTEIEVDAMPKSWIPGMFVEVSMIIDETNDALAVPNESIVYDNNRAFVFRVANQEKSDGRTLASAASPANDEAADVVQKVPIKTGLRDGKFTAVLEGLEEFDMIVTEGQGTLADGSKVEVVR